MLERGRAIVLIGFMGAGKSSVGRRLETRTGFPRFDTDQMIAAKLNLSIPRIFETRGEDFFRDEETKVVRDFDVNRDAIIITGGGIVLRTSNRELLRKLGVVVYLQADEQTLFARLSRRSNRPLLRTDDPRSTMRDLLEKRVPLYEEIADLAVDTSQLDHNQVCDLILESVDAGKPK